MLITFRGSKTATYFKSGTAVAASYADAIEAYMADNGQRFPMPGSEAWPTNNERSFNQGPRDPMRTLSDGRTLRPYMRSIPEAVSGGSVQIIAPGQTPKQSAQVAIDIMGNANSAEYKLRVRTLRGDEASRMVCVYTNSGQLEQGETRC